MHNPHVIPLDDGKSWLLEADYIIDCHDGRTLFIPKGFVFDFASIPRIAWRLFPPATGKHRIPALIHDWLCASKTVTWKSAADIFLKAMARAGVPKWKRYSMYYAVRAWEYFHDYDLKAVVEWQLLQRKRIKASQQLFSGKVI